MNEQQNSERTGGERTEGQEAESPLVLIVDDEPLALEMAERTLQRQGFGTLTARGGEQGLQLAREKLPDIVLLDITMPGMDGFAVFDALRSTPETEAIPVIFVTARDDTADKVHGLELGAVDYITKPYNLSELAARVRSTLRMRKLEREVAERSLEQGRRKLTETLLITMAHYINNALAAIDGRVNITKPEDPESVEKLLDVVRRRTRIINATLQAIEDIQGDLDSHMVRYASSDAEILDLEEEIQRRVERLEERDRELDEPLE